MRAIAVDRSHISEATVCRGSCKPQAHPLSRVAWLQTVTLIWMLIECVGSLDAAANAHSVALLAFGLR